MNGLALRDWTFPSIRSLLRGWDEPLGVNLPALLNESDFPVDISRDKESRVVVRATLPGFKKEEVKVQLEGNALQITAEHNEENESKGEDYYRKERKWSSVSRTIPLPGRAEKNGIDAELKDGVLTVKVPQAKEAKAEGIKIH